MALASNHLHRWATLCLLATLVFGVFGFIAPTHASMASSSNMDSMPGAAGVCFTQGCIQTHNTCEEHCVRPSDESSVSTAVIPSTNNQSPFSNQAEPPSIVLPNTVPIPIIDLDRTPPIHTFLRSVIKRE
ncbi:MAG: hypothetical protein AAB413_05310 [Patescibacteria group bacterium]